MTNLAEELQKTIQMQAETIKALLTVVAHLQQSQPTVNPFQPMPRTYIGDQPTWMGTGWVAPNIGTDPFPNLGTTSTSQFGITSTSQFGQQNVG